jgi:hypothetical protein
MQLLPADTSLDAARIQAGIFRRMAPGRRLELAFEMSQALRERLACGIRSRHPEYSEQQVRLAVIRLTLGDELFRQVYPGTDIAL